MNEHIEVPDTIPARNRVAVTYCDGEIAGFDFFTNEEAVAKYKELVVESIDTLLTQDVERHPFILGFYFVDEETGVTGVVREMISNCVHNWEYPGITEMEIKS